MRVVSAAFAILGAAIVGFASWAPYATVCDVYCVTNERPSLMDDAHHKVSAFILEPATAIGLVAIALVLIVAGRRPAGLLLATGLLTIVFFAGLLVETGSLPGGGIGAFMGGAGGLIIALAGIAAFTFRSRNGDNVMTAR